MHWRNYFHQVWWSAVKCSLHQSYGIVQYSSFFIGTMSIDAFVELLGNSANMRKFWLWNPDFICMILQVQWPCTWRCLKVTEQNSTRPSTWLYWSVSGTSVLGFLPPKILAYNCLSRGFSFPFFTNDSSGDKILRWGFVSWLWSFPNREASHASRKL